MFRRNSSEKMEKPLQMLMAWPITLTRFFCPPQIDRLQLRASLKIGQIALLPFAYERIFANLSNSSIHVSRHVVMQFLVLAGKPPCLFNGVAHAWRLRGTNGVA